MPAAPSPEQLGLLTLIWGLWAGLHSLLLMEGPRGRLERALGLRSAVYRLLYSVFSLTTIIPPLMYLWLLGGLRPYFWPGAWLGLQLALLAAGWGLLFWAGRSFSRGGLDLLGASQALRPEEAPPVLVSSGAYARLRHPMHVAGLVLLWSRSHTQADLAVSLLLSVYILLGTWHEERRLRRAFGQAYRDYARRVPLLSGLRRKP